MDMCPSVSYSYYATSPKGKTGDITTFAHFEQGNLISESFNDAESGDESDDN